MRSIKKTLVLFTLAAVCCLTGCSNVTQIYETDKRLHAQTETGFEEQFITLDARAAVYDGEYETFDIPAEANIQGIVAPIGDNSFVVEMYDESSYSIGSGYNILEHGGEYGIYTLGGGYKTLIPKYSEEDSQTKVATILYCNNEYILYDKAVLNSYGSIAVTELVDVYLLKLDDMTEKRIYRFMQPYATNAVVCGNAVYLERAGEKVWSDGVLKSMYSNSTIVKYDIEKGELEDFCLNAGSPVIYKDKPAFYVGDGTFVSQAEPLFLPEEYGLTAKSLKIFPSDEMAYSYYSSADGKDCTILGYIKDGKQFNIFRANDIISVYDISFADGYAVWDCNFFTDWRSKVFPMFYSDEKKSVIVIEDERSNYESLIHDGKIYFFDWQNYTTEITRVIVLDTENIK